MIRSGRAVTDIVAKIESLAGKHPAFIVNSLYESIAPRVIGNVDWSLNENDIE